MDENVNQFVKKDKELQKHILKMHLKSEDMFSIFYVLGFFLFFELIFVFVWPVIVLPIIIAEILIVVYKIFHPGYTVEEYEVREIYDNIISSKLLYVECVVTKPGNKGVDGYLRGNIIKSRNEKISIGDKVIAVKIGKKAIVTKYNS